MKITVTNRVDVSADVTVEQVEAYIVRRGGPLTMIPIIPAGEEGRAPTIIGAAIQLLGVIEQRQPGDVLSDIAGFAILDRGTAINRLATASARLVEAQETEKRVSAHMTAGREIARSRRQEAERAVEKAKAALAAAEGVEK